MKVRFISSNYVMEGFPSTEIEDQVVNYAIEKAQNLHIHKTLGTSLYGDIIEKVSNSAITAATDVTLMENYIQPCLRDYSIYELITLNSFKLSNAGLMKSTNENFTSVDLSELKHLKSEIRDSAEFFEERLKYYLCNNSASFPAYNYGTQDIKQSGRGDSYFFGIS
tara:strand:- start:7138 stop:7635 length:498 start_codon:yes stop_codon:yes gene_type:complete